MGWIWNFEKWTWNTIGLVACDLRDERQWVNIRYMYSGIQLSFLEFVVRVMDIKTETEERCCQLFRPSEQADQRHA